MARWLTSAEKAQFASTLPIFQELPSEIYGELADTLEQRFVEAGATICQRGEASDCLYIVVAGRFRVFVEDNEKEKATAEVGRGETIGDIGLLTGEKRSATVVAVRDSSVLTLSKQAFDDLKEKHSGFLLSLARTQIERLHRLQQPRPAPIRSDVIAVVPAGGTSIADFTGRLGRSLSRIGEVVHLRNPQTSTPAHTEHDSVDDWLQSPAESSRFVIYESDDTTTDWTASCIRQADRLVFVADGDATPSTNQIESDLPNLRSAVISPRRDLVILRSENNKPVASAWLAGRQVDLHYNVNKTSEADYDRLARLIAGKAVGLVLGGGGARSFAHIGVIQALTEAGVPIDMVGGTSMGALIGALTAMGLPAERIVETCRYIFIQRGIWDFTLPLVSLLSPKRITASLESIFSDLAIEDLPKNYYCISTNLSAGDVAVHRSGPLVKWLKASISIPGIAPPTIDQGQLFYDGGILNNVPVDVMNLLGVTRTIAVSSGSLFDQRLVEVEPEHCSPWRILLNRLNPFSKPISFPSIFNILYRSAMLSSDRSAVTAQGNASLLIAPKVSQYGLFQWNAIDEIVEAGRVEGRKQLAKWANS
jgi:predicted acylesterase/phospholipase RssA/CRP-like cAMP-binding protein